MSAFAVCFHRDGTYVPRETVAAMLDAQHHRGSDRNDVFTDRAVGLGYRSLWTIPEETDEKQPVTVPGLPLSLLWHGRIDNRGDLLAQLGVRSAEADCWSDAQLFLRLYAEKGTRLLSNIVGSFALAVYDRHDHALLLARDPIGHRDLNFHLSDRLLLAASEESGVLSHPRVSPEVNAGKLADLFAFNGFHTGETFFTHVVKLLPGHFMTVDTRRSATTRYWAPDAARRIYYRDEREYADHYRELLEQAVACRTRSSRGIGVMTSGGLDSGPIAALAAGRSGGAKPVYSLSWVFDRYTECDERQYLSPLRQRFALEPVDINCDTAQPFSDLAHWPVHPDTPDQDPYRRFLDNTYAAARSHGVRVLLNGTAGDNLYAGGERWFWELLRARRIAALLTGTRWYVNNQGLRKFVRRVLVRSALPFGVVRRLRPRPVHEWVTEDAIALMHRGERWPPEYRHARRPGQLLSLLSLRATDFINAESYWSNRWDVEVRHPLRDQRIIEFMLQIPDHQLGFMDTTRPVLRAAVADLLPQPQLHRSDKTSFAPLFRDGAVAEAESIHGYLTAPSRTWTRFVQENWVTGDDAPTQEVADTLKWTALSVELWRVANSLSL